MTTNKLPLPEKDTRNMSFSQKQEYVMAQLQAMGIQLEPGRKKPGDGDFSAIIGKSKRTLAIR